MRKKANVFDKLNTRILLVLLILFAVISTVIGVLNNINIRGLYEESYTERLLLANALMGSLVHNEDIEYFVDLMKNQSDDFKARQVEFYHDREVLFRLQEEGASEEQQAEATQRLVRFHDETQALKNDAYWDTLDALKELKEISRSTYVYVMAATGLRTRDGETLYTYIFDAEDDAEYSSPDMDGLGTSDVGNEAFTNVFETKKQTETAEHYAGDFGELYFVCVPLLNDDGDVIAVLGTDIVLDEMNEAISRSSLLFDIIIVAVFVVSVAVIFIFLRHNTLKPLGSLTKTALMFAEGNLNTPISESALKQRTEIGMLAHAIKSTLDATTLYLNSIPETLFIMNRSRETLFRNTKFIERFGDMQAADFMSALFSEQQSEMPEQQLYRERGGMTVWIDGSCFAVLLREITLHGMPEKSILVIANDITDLMNEKENAQAAARAKSDFLSRMSHEMRTPMNAILGMARVAADSDSLPAIRHCISTINASSVQLLGIINDVLDMSKIEAGKLELEKAPINFEKTLMRVVSLVIDSMEKKRQKFKIELDPELRLHYIADDLRLSQVLTNLLSNAVKFTNEGGAITLRAENTARHADTAVLRVRVSDTGIGMTGAQISRLFNAFEQADGSIARKYGGSGLGLAISQSIIESMGGHIEVISEHGAGSAFSFEIPLECAPREELAVDAASTRLLIIEPDYDVREQFLSIASRLGVRSDAAENLGEALELLDSSFNSGDKYDIVFIDCGISQNSLDILSRDGRVDSGSIVAVTTFLDWHRVEKYALERQITRYVTKPLFPASILSAINEAAGQKPEPLDAAAQAQDVMPDLSGVRVLMAEDVEINAEVFLALMEDTNISTEIAVNGLEAVAKFKEQSGEFDLIIMDIQMPEMDGYEATRAIRALDIPWAKDIPIIAMSANAFKEDIERCFDSGMNDHLAKPIDVDIVIEKIVRHLSGRGE